MNGWSDKDLEKAYHVYRQHHFHENKQFERKITAFLLTNSILFLGLLSFIDTSKVVSVLLCVIAISVSYGIYESLKTSVRALDFWLEAQAQIEKEGGGFFAYMRENERSPILHGRHAWEKGVFLARWRLFPHTTWLAAMVFWVGALVYVLTIN